METSSRLRASTDTEMCHRALASATRIGFTPLWRAASEWLASDWPFGSVEYAPRA